jgi:methionyl-tRNA synthetase
VLYNLAEVLRIVGILVTPFMPNTPKHIYGQLNIGDDKLKTWDAACAFGLLGKDVGISKGEIVFPRIDIKKELEEWEKPLAEVDEAEAAEEITVEEITIDEFARIKLKVGLITACEFVKGSDRLLKSQVKIGGETRQIVSGIAKFYAPEQMVGKKVIIVTNLKPVKIRGEMSYGMLLAASDDNDLNVVTVDGGITDGAGVS